MIKRILVFLFFNFGALAVGGWLSGEGPGSSWYQDLNQAPWTPPGWSFGVAWTTIMFCFSLYMALLWGKVNHKKTLTGIYAGQWILNVAWNPVFFNWQQPLPALLIITGLLITVGLMLKRYHHLMKWKSLLIWPYFLWLMVALSLNGYIVVMN